MRRMQPAEFILRKRNGAEHTKAELEQFLMGFQRGEVADYQVAAWLMAVCFQGMTDRETADLPEIRAASAARLALGNLPHPVDRHRTGGVATRPVWCWGRCSRQPVPRSPR